MSSILATISWLASTAAAVSLSVSATGGNVTSPYQYGIMFEEINHAGDGGIYAELIQNRAFQGSSYFPTTLDPWTAVGGASLSLHNDTTPLSSSLPTSVLVTTNSTGTFGLSNPGFWGIDVQRQKYTGSFWVKGDYHGKFTASLRSALSSDIWGSTTFSGHSSSSNWTHINFELEPTTSAPYANNTFVLEFHGNASTSLQFNLISLFPPTFNNRENGMRVDLMTALKDLNPSFLRLPGGSNLEGLDISSIYKWNQTIGPLTDRPGRAGVWNYQNTDGIGLAEYLNWCEDLEMEPVLAVWAGLTLAGPIAQAALEPYIQDALDELEYVLGDVSTPYGALRASHGRQEPWSVKYVEIGNEDNLSGGLGGYEAYRLADFYNAIKAVYPNITVMSSTIHYFYNGSAGDSHVYDRPDGLVTLFDLYDVQTSTNPVLIGEFSATQENDGVNTGVNWTTTRPELPWWIGAVSEAVFLLGGEKNADKIIGATYAPLFQNLNSYAWTPDMIAFTANEVLLSTSYYVFKLFSTNRFTEVLPTAVLEGAIKPAYWVAGSTENGFMLKAAVYNSTSDVPFSVAFEGVAAGTNASLTVLTAADGNATNVLGSDNVVISTESIVTADEGGVFDFSLPNLSVAVLRTE